MSSNLKDIRLHTKVEGVFEEKIQALSLHRSHKLQGLPFSDSSPAFDSMNAGCIDDRH